jgi:AraC family ethanolamine operon transcriptional activator
VLMQWLEAIPERVALTDTKSLRQRRQVVDRACEVMLDRPDAPKTMLEVCSEIGVSPRKLEYCFRDVLGLSPNKYLRALRLNGVRRDLKRSRRTDAAVQDVAARWGFWHLGDFSADYKRHFDELPSQTLRGQGMGASTLA